MNNLLEDAKSLFPYSQRLRREFHRHPELGFHENWTAGVITTELNQIGLDVTTGIAETGVIGLLDGVRPGPVVLVRFDIDALPVHEELQAEYRSQIDGVMHACGHDGHMAIGLTVARLLVQRRDQINGTVKFVFQPAEEGLGGAERMLAEGVLDAPKVDYALSMHLWNQNPVGWLGIAPGSVMAGADIFKATIQGKGGHGGIPEQTVDPVLASAQIITALQSIVSRNVSPLNSAVVSVTSVRAGEAFNVIPPSAELRGTIRTFQPSTREMVLQRMEEIITGVSSAMGCEAELDLQLLTPPVVNDPDVTEQVLRAAQTVFPDAKIDRQVKTSVSEDMAFMLDKIPGCYFFVGSANPEKGLNHSHHSPSFDFDEAALPVGSALMSAAILRLLQP